MMLLSGSSQTISTEAEIGTSNPAQNGAPNRKLAPKGPDIESEHRRSAHLLALITYLLFQRVVGIKGLNLKWLGQRWRLIPRVIHIRDLRSQTH
jgi:hypothetical protein